MLHSKTRWDLAVFGGADETAAGRLAAELQLAPLAARLLVQRGIRNADEARIFLRGGPELLHDPYLLKDMEAAVERIRAAGRLREKIRIYGDYDADGVSSTALMIRLFRLLDFDFDYYIPHRAREGYGLNTAAVEAAAAAGVKLIVTVDNGISAVVQVACAAELGVDVVVTDHHEPPEVVPRAVAVVNPKQADCPYPFKGLAGVGVAFKLAQALLGRPPLEWAELAALGTIADLMPLLDENRVIARCGLEQLRRTDSPGLRALAKVGGIELASAQADTIAFGMAPRINAGGRIDSADPAVELLTTDDPQRALDAAATLDRLNRERQSQVERMVEEAEEAWAAKCADAAEAGRDAPAALVIAGEGWNAGVVGIVASKLVERHYRPAFVLAVDPSTGVCKGSARSIDGFDLHAALTACDDLLDHYGGHQAAAGMTLAADRLAAFEERLSRLAAERLTEEDRIRRMPVDLACTVDEADLPAVEQLALLEPFGAGNPQPRILLQGVRLSEKRLIGKESKHLRLSAARSAGGALEAVGFGMGELAARISDAARVDLVGELTINEWNGRRKAQLLIRDLRVPHVQFFDGRMTRDKRRAVAALLREANADAPPPRVVALSTDPACAETAAAGEATGGLRMVHYGHWPAEGIACDALALFDPPPSLERLAAIVRSARSLSAVHALFAVERRAGPRLPERGRFAEFYRALRRMKPEELQLERLIAGMAGSGWPEPVVRMMTQVFEELGFISVRDGAIAVAPNPAKRELSESPTYARALREAEAERMWRASCEEWADWIARELAAAADGAPSPLQAGTNE